MSSYERSQIADAIKTESYQSGAQIIKEGDAGNVFYMIMEGEATAFKTIDGKQVEVMHYMPGDYFGERALLKNEP